MSRYSSTYGTKQTHLTPLVLLDVNSSSSKTNGRRYVFQFCSLDFLLGAKHCVTTQATTHNQQQQKTTAAAALLLLLLPAAKVKSAAAARKQKSKKQDFAPSCLMCFTGSSLTSRSFFVPPPSF
jgi:hypothetical protein